MLLFYFFAAIQLYFGYKSLQGGVRYLRYFKSELASSLPDYQPFASVIVPCRGIDVGIERNLKALFTQHYREYEVIFVLDSKTDRAIPIIEKLMAKHDGARIVVAGTATASGQKVHNLIKAAHEITTDSEVLVFVDSDARPGRNWLRNLVAPLADERIGCSSGYRWFIQKTGGFATHLRSVWNASIASALGANTSDNFCWGGSTAIRRKVFERLKIVEKWEGTLSDDFVLTSTLKEAGLPIYFAPSCLTATVEDTSFNEMLEFTTRQMKITRVYSFQLWVMSLISAFLFTAIFWTGVIFLFFAQGIHFRAILTILLTIFLLGAAKAWLRLKAVRLVLLDYEKELKGQFFWQITLWVVSPILFFYNNLRALFSRRIVWRGIEYELESTQSTRILGNYEQ